MIKQVEEVGNLALVNKSATKTIKNKLIDSSSQIENILEDIIPKKSQLQSAKVRCGDFRVELFAVDKEMLFFSKDFDDNVYPHLKLLHKYPGLLPRMQIDKGGIKFILNGANVMCAGVTSKGGSIDMNAQIEKPVAIFCEGKEHALGVGKLLMTPEDIKTQNSGHCIELIHILNDGLWNLKDFSKKK